MNRKIKVLFGAIIIMALIGVADSVYAVTLHYAADSDSFCNLSERVNCDVVNTSDYSSIYGIPVAGIGVAGYLFYGFLAASLLAGIDYRGLAAPALVAAAAAGTLFSLGLTYIEFFVLEAVCILCVVSQVLVILILAASIAVAISLGRSDRGLGA
ncbi:MAG: vitamin K epoxide reductase family protein [Thermoleophilia bacterium]